MKIVIMDDDMALLKTLEMPFDNQHDVVVFHGPRNACEYFRTDLSVDILIIEYMMPSMTGDKFVLRIREHLPGT